MADKQGHLTKERRFGGGILLNPPNESYGAVKNPEQGKRKRLIELFADAIKLDQEIKEIWDCD